MGHDPFSVSSSQNLDRMAQEISNLEETQQVAADKSLTEWLDTVAFNPLAGNRLARTIEERKKTVTVAQVEKESDSSEEEILTIQEVEQISQEFEQRNPELQAANLRSLRAKISKNDSAEEILRKVLEAYPDSTLADEVLDFLIQTSAPDLAAKVKEAKEKLQAGQKREILAGKNIDTEAKLYAKAEQGLQKTPTELRNLYRDITVQSKEAVDFFSDLSKSYSYDQLKTLLTFLLSSLGSDLKAKGPSIEPGQLHELVSKTRAMQAIWQVYRFFEKGLSSLHVLFNKEHLTFPSNINFEILAKLFVGTIVDAYPSPEKILRLASQLGLESQIVAQIIIFSQMRDAIRKVAPRLFRSEQHRQDLLLTYMSALDELDDIIESLEDEQEEQRKQQEGNAK